MVTKIGAEYRLASRHPDFLAHERAFEFGRMLRTMLQQYPDVDLATIRLEDIPATITDPACIRITGETR